jgi:SPP1 family predicted phage head-tail adaptor
MNVSRFQYKVALQTRDAGEDDHGQPLQTWTTFAEPMADIRYLSGVESVRAGAVTSVAKASIRIWYRTDVTVGMRVIHGTTVYNVTAVQPDMARRLHVDLVCEVVT